MDPGVTHKKECPGPNLRLSTFITYGPILRGQESFFVPWLHKMSLSMAQMILIALGVHMGGVTNALMTILFRVI